MKIAYWQVLLKENGRWPGGVHENPAFLCCMSLPQWAHVTTLRCFTIYVSVLLLLLLAGWNSATSLWPVTGEGNNRAVIFLLNRSY